MIAPGEVAGSVAILGGVATVFGAFISLANAKFKVWEDRRVGANSPWGPGWGPPPLPPDGTWEVQATFDEPGTYVVRCLAHDGGLMTFQDITVVVQ